METHPTSYQRTMTPPSTPTYRMTNHYYVQTKFNVKLWEEIPLHSYRTRDDGIVMKAKFPNLWHLVEILKLNY